VTRAAGHAMAAKLPEICDDVNALSDPLNSIDIYEGPLHWLKQTDPASLEKYFKLCLPQTSTVFWQQDRNACISSIVRVWNVRDADETDWQVRRTLCSLLSMVQSGALHGFTLLMLRKMACSLICNKHCDYLMLHNYLTF